MGRYFSWLLHTAAALAVSCPAHSLEKRAVRYDRDGADDWAASATCLVSYYNICTEWVWLWEFDDPTIIGDQNQIGVNVTGGGSWALLQSRIVYWSGSPAGYGFTGTIATYAADANGCPVGSPIDWQPFLPPYYTGGHSDYVQNWSGANPLPASFVLAATFPSDAGGINSLVLETDFGTIGSTGPDACGLCFPSPRVSHSFVWMDSQGSYCPGRTFLEQECEVELLWDLTLSCTVSVESSTWGAIKTLYR